MKNIFSAFSFIDNFKIAKVFVSVIKYSGLLTFALVLVGFGQLSQAINSISDLRSHEIEMWKLENPEKNCFG